MKIIAAIIAISLLLSGSYYYLYIYNAEQAAPKFKIIDGDVILEGKKIDAEIAVLAGGSFWELESHLLNLGGVIATRVGYIGGDVANPSYELVLSGTTGHMEAVEFIFDKSIISYKEIIDAFLKKAHDPTKVTVKNSVGSYHHQSVIYYIDQEQKKIADRVLRDVKRRKIYDKPLVTRIAPMAIFYEAESHMQKGSNNLSPEEREQRIMQWLRTLK